ncbi:probable LRR receptor-like serine/threonine-protein kinase At3g47570 [Rutidosis leptorrhynchoides]|uniref:probable LRR receptor-like serine/threonine-protein kinase At3g47570 n=1 Tax=Rutidosis leptorrhynchoides TaxID=125765 RepID=UPI003A98F1E3
MRGLVELDLSHNNLSGQIPRFLEVFSLQALDLSFNDFEGEVLVKGVLANASEFSITGNMKLCGGLVELGLPKCKAKEKKKGQPSQSSTHERFLKVSYDQLLKATDGFSEANLIGKGWTSSVYKGVLENDVRFDAVKVLHLQTQGAHKNFIREYESWRSIRHRNLLKIITSCSTVDFQEYGLGSEMTSSGVVYGFRILLLEVMTGKIPTDDIFNEGLSLHRFVSMALLDHAITDVIDKDAITVKSTKANAYKVEECLASTLKIGLSCSTDSPTRRMKIENNSWSQVGRQRTWVAVGVAVKAEVIEFVKLKGFWIHIITPGGRHLSLLLKLNNGVSNVQLVKNITEESSVDRFSKDVG